MVDLVMRDNGINFLNKAVIEEELRLVDGLILRTPTSEVRNVFTNYAILLRRELDTLAEGEKQ